MKTMVIAILLVLCGCVGDATKGLNDQNKKAAVVIQQHATDTTSLLAAKDIEKNCDSIAGAIGMPKIPVAYSPAVSEDLRRKQDAINSAGNWVTDTGLPWLLTLLFGTGGGLIYRRLRTANQIKEAVYEGVDEAKEILGKKVGEELTTVLRNKAGKKYELIKADLNAFRKRTA